MFAEITSEHHTEGQLAFIGRDWLTVRALDSATGVGALDLSVIVLKPHGALILIQGYMTDMRVSASALLLCERWDMMYGCTVYLHVLLTQMTWKQALTQLAPGDGVIAHVIVRVALTQAILPFATCTPDRGRRLL